ncbi:glycosyl transferase family 1 [Gammaproteobacteria bacterium SCGC AG-212-F23]|nr:glycosyl transferase family 1 [Gammaproteobacteria bacterium SCGC AG-212-F23]
MKIAIVCDWLITHAGAERVLAEILQCFPSADVFAVVDFVPPEKRDFLLNKPVKTTFIQHLLFAKKYYRHYLPLMPLAIEQLDVSTYDVVISSSHAVAKGVITAAHQLHISYIHSPMRYAWDLQHQYLKDAGLEKGIKSFLVKYMLHKMRLWDLRTANNVDYFIANSHFIARRIWKTYRRDAEVIYPAVDTQIFTPSAQKENFYLAASRLVSYKKMDVIVESFSAMPDKKLIVIGDGPDFAKIKAKAKDNITFLGFQPIAQLIHYLQQAKAFIFAAEEDFGLLPVEAQACGTPVIAFAKGGALETVRGLDTDHPTGIFFHEQTTAAIQEAIAVFEENETVFKPEFFQKNVARFSQTEFREQFKNFVLQKACNKLSVIA